MRQFAAPQSCPSWGVYGLMQEEGRPDAQHIVWSETKQVGPFHMHVEARALASSGVGWVDLAMSSEDLSMVIEQKRVLADWRGMSRAQLVRQVVKTADAWHECVLRCAALEALAGTLRQIAEDPTSQMSGGSDGVGQYFAGAHGTAVARSGTMTAPRGHGLIVNGRHCGPSALVKAGDVVAVSGAPAMSPVYTPDPSA